MTRNPDTNELAPLLKPGSVALVGASSSPVTGGGAYAVHLTDEYRGKCYFINPREEEILGRKTYPRLRDVPDPVEYVICCISAKRVLDLLDECREKGVKIVHLFTARMAETGRDDGIRLEEEITRRAGALGIRLLGPNCMGVYHPGIGLTYGYSFPREPGPVGGIFQSGGLSTDFVHYGALRGLRFSSVVSYGNAVDIDETELLGVMADDPDTRVIAMYIEGIRAGRAFRAALRSAAEKKPVVVLKGGKGEAGARSVSSHTASLAGGKEVWEGIIRGANAVTAGSFSELIDLAVGFHFLPPFTGNRVAVTGGGGGKGILSADRWEAEGFVLPDLPPGMREEMRKTSPGLSDWLHNPVDVSILQDSPMLPEELFVLMEAHGGYDLFILNLTEDDPLPEEFWRFWTDAQVTSIAHYREAAGKPVTAVVADAQLGPGEMGEWRWGLIGEVRRKIIRSGIPVFPTPERAARAARKVAGYWQRRESRTRT